MNQPSHTAHSVRIHIDEQRHDSPNPTTGAELYKLAQVPSEMVLYKEVEGDKEDPEVPNDHSPIHLKEDEHFHSGKPRRKGTQIYVNTHPILWDEQEISYDQLVKLAFPDGPTGGNIIYTITWTKPDWQEGVLLPGQRVKVVEEMAFDVRNTDKS
jgi:hypothetical protein